MQYKLCIHAILFHYSILKVRTFCYKRKKIFTPLHLFILLQNSRILLTYTAAGKKENRQTKEKNFLCLPVYSFSKESTQLKTGLCQRRRADIQSHLGDLQT